MFCSRGGAGATKILDYLDYDLIIATYKELQSIVETANKLNIKSKYNKDNNNIIKTLVGNRYIGDDCAYLEDLGITESGLDNLIKESYDLLGLATFFTAGEKECRHHCGKLSENRGCRLWCGHKCAYTYHSR